MYGEPEKVDDVAALKARMPKSCSDDDSRGRALTVVPRRWILQPRETVPGICPIQRRTFHRGRGFLNSVPPSISGKGSWEAKSYTIHMFAHPASPVREANYLELRTTPNSLKCTTV